MKIILSLLVAEKDRSLVAFVADSTRTNCIRVITSNSENRARVKEVRF